jgi:hypothetical protein
MLFYSTAFCIQAQNSTLEDTTIYFKLNDTRVKNNSIHVFHYDVEWDNYHPELIRLLLIPDYDSLVYFLNSNKSVVIEIECYSDLRGSNDQNKNVTEFHAEQFKKRLIRSGIKEERVLTKGLGCGFPAFLDSDYVFVNEPFKGISFFKGTLLDKDYINTLESNRQKEAAQWLNKRFVVRIVSF